MQKTASRCGDEDRSCVDRTYRLVIQKKRLIARFKRSFAESCSLDLGMAKRQCHSGRFRRWIRRVRQRKQRLHRSAKRCSVRNVGCTKRFARRIARINRAIRRHSKRCTAGRRHSRCSKRSVRRWLRRARARRTRYQSLTTSCDDEDSGCVKRYMTKIMRLNRGIARRQRRCGIKSKAFKRNSWAVTDTVHHVITESVWRHAIDCEAMRDGFARWLKYMRGERKRLHDNVCKDCSPRDTQCLRERYERIMALQHAIKKGRTEYTALVTKCDACAPVRLRFERWVKLQTARRKRLHAEICNCADTDTQCVVRRVMRIKKIQQRIKDGRAHIFHLNEHCKDDTNEESFLGPLPTSATVAPATAAPVLKVGGTASMISGVFASIAVVAMAALLL